MFIVFLRFGVLVNFMVSWYFVDCSLIIWLHGSTLPEFISPLLSRNPSNPHYSPSKVLLIVMCTLLSQWWRIWEPCQAYGRLHLWNDSWVNLCYFQMHEWECSTFSKSVVRPIYLALFHSMCLRDVLFGSLGVIKFDVELTVVYIVESIHLLLILKCIAHYLGCHWLIFLLVLCYVLPNSRRL